MPSTNPPPLAYVTIGLPIPSRSGTEPGGEPLTLEEREHLARLHATAANFGVVGAARTAYLDLRRRGRAGAPAEERALRTRLDALDLSTRDGRAEYRRVIAALAFVLDDLAFRDGALR